MDDDKHYCGDCLHCHVEAGEWCHCHRDHWSRDRRLAQIGLLRPRDCVDFEPAGDDDAVA